MYIVAGDYLFSGEEIIVIKLSFQGEIEWQKAYGGSGWDSFHSMGLTVDGGYIVAGRTESFGPGRARMWILKLSSLGEIEWQKTYGGEDNYAAYSIEQTFDGGYIVAGDNRLFGTNPSNLRIIKLRADGNLEWQKTYGGAFDDEAQSMLQTIDGGYILAGSSCSFGAGVIAPGEGSESDIWLFKLNPDGTDSFCSLSKDYDVEVKDTDASPIDTDRIFEDSNIRGFDSSAIVTPTDAVVFDYCTDQYVLKIQAVGAGTTNPSPGRYYFDPGSEVNVFFTPYPRFSFSSWLGDVHNTSNPITITMDRHKSIKPNYGYDTGPDTRSIWNETRRRNNCFIATAAYNSPSHPHVKTLQKFRDKYLMSNKPGRKLVNLYYRYSPHIAELITNHRALKTAVRIWLLPVVAVGYSMVQFGPIKTTIMLVLVLMLPFFMVWFYRRACSTE